ncbi:methyltransferase domain-containing protein [Sphingobacteriales bacterium UPWRP_1]|nr:SAM-dependent methyltransferase [Sphingobacteriales bacterium TSM_CSM]PSJ77831.1 methyltransferase domain-containing protein [Sphingobacteriales bacterium UPWRP_1]
MELTQDYWQKRYEENSTGWDIGGVSTPLKTYFDQLNNKNLRILIPGCGNAYEAAYLVENGFTNVFLLDWAMAPLNHFKRQYPAFPEEQLICANFFEHTGQYDLIVEQTFFCALNPALRPTYAKHVYQLLKTNGKLVGLLFNLPLNTDKPPFGGNKTEYLAYFEPWFRILVMDLCTNSIAPRAGNELFILMQKKTDL